MSDKRWTVAGKRGSWGNPEHLLWPDDQDPDLPHKFTASHMGEAWPDTSDSIVDAAFVALVDAVKSAACLRSSDARLTLDGPDRRGWYVLRMDGAPVADLDPVESAAVAEVISQAAQVLPPGVPLMQVDHAQPVPSSPDSGESRSRAAGPESEPAEPRRAGAPPHEASSYACERALRVVADLALLATRVRSLAAPYEAGGPSDELRRTVAGLLAPFLDYNASPIVAADAVLATAGISDALARDAAVSEIVADTTPDPKDYSYAAEVLAFEAIAALHGKGDAS